MNLQQRENYPAPQHNDLQDRAILITGATQGLGREVALAAAKAGATVILLARSVRGLEKVYDEILSAGGAEPVAIPLDLLTAGDAEFDNVALQIHQTLARLDGVVHCASHMYALSPLLDQRIDEWVNQYRINTVAPFALTRACFPLLQRAKDASVIFVGETHGLHAGAFWGAFGASHAALPHLTKVAANEWDRFEHLRVNLIIPGPMATPQRTRTHPGEPKASRPDPATLMPAMIYLLSEKSRGISGEVIEFLPPKTC